jgi:hypothetical protein
VKVFFILGALFLSLPIWSHTRAPSPQEFLAFAEAQDEELILEILWKVITREGRSKNYPDLLPLDGGTVGIAHFAVGGLENLYEEMNTAKYFHRSADEMIQSYSSDCRPKGHRGDDTGWGCYSKAWWRNGMTAFLYSEESKDVQNRAFINKMRPLIERIYSKGWNTRRKLAIAIGVANSKGRGGFIKIANQYEWNAERVLKVYASGSAHRQRRADAINQF